VSGPVRFRESGSPLERELASSSDVDAPIEGAKSRAFAALGISAVGASIAPTIATTAAKRALFGIHLSSSVKIVGAVAIASATAVGGYEMHVHRAAEITANQRPSVIVPAPTISAAPVLPTPIASSSLNDPVPSALPKSVAASSTAHDQNSQELAPRPHHDDSAELTWIDRAQSSLKNDPARALEIVDAYRQTVSPRAFDEEASVIAIEASERTGDTARAQREADRFFVTYPHSAYRSRIDALLSASRSGAK
jgi:hypothetical protein